MQPNGLPVFDIELEDPFLTSDDHYPPFSASPAQIQTSIQLGPIGIYSVLGRRVSNLDRIDYKIKEDCTLLAVYDGHCDAYVVDYLHKNLLDRLSKHALVISNTKQALFEIFSAIEEEVVKSFEKGSTALVAVLTPQNIVVANLGDSKIFGILQDESHRELNTIHNLTNTAELHAVIERGGTILRNRKQYRINGELNLSRCFGDVKYKKVISSLPEIYEYGTKDFKRVVLATDGFYNQSKLPERLLMKSVKELSQMQTVYSDNASALFYDCP